MGLAPLEKPLAREVGKVVVGVRKQPGALDAQDVGGEDLGLQARRVDAREIEAGGRVAKPFVEAHKRIVNPLRREGPRTLRFRHYTEGGASYVEEFRKVRSLARTVGANPHRWGVDAHIRKGVRVADLFVAAMVVVALALSGFRPPWFFFILFPLPVLLFGFALILVVSAQSRDEARIAEIRERKRKAT